MRKTLLPLALAFASLAEADIRLGAPFADGAVLQRDRDVPVWGTASPREKVTVSFCDFLASAQADAKGAWSAKLPAMKASKEGRDLVASGADGAKAIARDILVGEVWLCAGQSNADCPIWGRRPHYRDGQGALVISMTVKPWVRLAKVVRQPSETPLSFTRVKWLKMVPEEMRAGKGHTLPSAMGYYFALELANALDVPVGLLDCSWGATRIEPWTPRSGFGSVEGLEKERDWEFLPKEQWVGGSPVNGCRAYHQQPSAIWNGMVAPLAPMAARGMIWYQGCSNAREPETYARKMHALYNGWAKEFANPRMSFYFAQLAPFKTDFHRLQEAQTRFAEEEPNAAMAVTGDVGNILDIHPNDKRTVAKRLAAHALKRDYGYDWIEDESPSLESWRVENGAFMLKFRHALEFYVYNRDNSLETGFEVCGADGEWKPAEIMNFEETQNRFGKIVREGTVPGPELVVASKDVPDPVRLRYLHTSPWFASLYNEASLPMGPFHIGGDDVEDEEAR